LPLENYKFVNLMSKMCLR